MPSFLRTFSVSDGVVAAETSPTTEELYATPHEMEALYGCPISEQQLRAIQSLINGHCNRASLWPTELESSPLHIPMDRQETRLAVTPVISVLEAAGRYGFGRRDRLGWNAVQHGYAAILAITAAAKPAWTPIDVNAIEYDPSTGIIYLPWSLYFAPFSYVKVRYIAGYITIPARVKMAIAELANSMSGRGMSDRVRYSVGRVSRQFAGDSFVTPQAQQLLAPFVVSELA